MNYDHFHAGIILNDGSIIEVEGGWTGLPSDWKTKSPAEKDKFLLLLACEWAEVKEAKELKYFRLAG